MEIDNNTIPSDQRLIDRAISGDSAAFGQLFNRYRDSIFQFYLQRTGGNRDDASDLLQETFIKVYLNLHRYNPGFAFGQWIFTIARNTFIDHMRKRRDDMSLDIIPEGYGGIIPAAGAPTPEESIIHSQQKAQLERYLDKMSARYRNIIELRYFRDFSYEEISAELGIPIGTVKTQIHRARAELCRFITDQSDILE